MRVYVESNFVLELAFEQEQHESCEALLGLVEQDASVVLAVPAFSFFEAGDKLYRKDHGLGAIQNLLDVELRELKRTKQFTKEEEEAFVRVSKTLVRRAEEADQRLGSVRDRLFQAAKILPLDEAVISSALGYQTDFELDASDALILASVTCDPELGRGPTCFLNRNTRDFDAPAIKQLLASRRCRPIWAFDQGLAYVQSTLNRSDPGRSGMA